MENILMLTIGLPYSGKSGWAQANSGSPIVNPDSIRRAMHGQRFAAEAEELVWAMAKIIVRSLFLAGHNAVIVDACHTHEKRRDFWKDRAWKREYVVMDVAPEECTARAIAAGDNEILPHIERMAENFELEGVFWGQGGIDRIPMSGQLQWPGPGKAQIYHAGQAFD